MLPSQFDPAPARRAAVVMIFPGALGDFLCCLPAIAARAASAPGGVRIAGRDSWLPLAELCGFETHSIESRAITELYRSRSGESAGALLGGAAEVHSWSGSGDADFRERLRAASAGARVEVYPFRAFAPGEHAADYYARCLGVKPPPLRLSVSEAAAGWARNWAARRNPEGRPLLLIHAGSGGAAKLWSGFDAVAAHWSERGGIAVELAGPAEAGRHRLRHTAAVVEEDLPRVAALLERAAAYAGNDSGITHLAAAVGVAGVAVFRPEAVVPWRPRSPRIAVVVAGGECAECDSPGICVHRVPVERVILSLGRLSINDWTSDLRRQNKRRQDDGYWSGGGENRQTRGVGGWGMGVGQGHSALEISRS